MASARCPVCEDIITIGIAVKLYQPVTCPTCLANLEVVSMSPFELEQAQRNGSPAARSNRPNHKKTSKPGKKLPVDDLDEEDDYEEFDDYVLEKRLRTKSDPEKRRGRED
jgi:lysine biosynthesis protein LysW